jgi:hypothetical protein
MSDSIQCIKLTHYYEYSLPLLFNLHQLTFCDIEWVLKDKYVGSTFFDASASAFIMPELSERCSVGSCGTHTTIGPNRVTNCETSMIIESDVSDEKKSGKLQGDELRVGTVTVGAGLGPEWMKKSDFLAQIPDSVKTSRGELKVHYAVILSCMPWHLDGEMQSHRSFYSG